MIEPIKHVTIYTDGACSGNPGPGGWAAILLYKARRKELAGSYSESTNNRMEIVAAIRGLEALKEPCYVNLYSDSAYLCNAFNHRWITVWQQNGWVNSKRKPVENQDLWITISNLAHIHRVTWIKVAGHADNELNNRCDQLAREQIEIYKKKQKASANTGNAT